MERTRDSQILGTICFVLYVIIFAFPYAYSTKAGKIGWNFYNFEPIEIKNFTLSQAFKFTNKYFTTVIIYTFIVVLSWYFAKQNYFLLDDIRMSIPIIGYVFGFLMLSLLRYDVDYHSVTHYIIAIMLITIATLFGWMLYYIYIDNVDETITNILYILSIIHTVAYGVLFIIFVLSASNLLPHVKIIDLVAIFEFIHGGILMAIEYIFFIELPPLPTNEIGIAGQLPGVSFN